ncbi:MAG: adenylate/guanylate cyclase domain-containing protein [Ktedonobacteraceae bacterium]
MKEKQHTSYDVEIMRLPLLRHISLKLLEMIKREGMIRYYRDGEVRFHQGDEPDGLYFLLHGQVRILTDGIFLVTRCADEAIGEQAFINQTIRSATVVAQGVVKALVLPRLLVERLMGDSTFTGNLLRFVSQKLGEATNERAFRFRNEHLLFSEFSAHLSPAITQRLLATGLAYGEPRYIDAIILFADIRSFTEQSVRLAPQDIARQSSLYFDAMVSVIHHHEGFVDKFIGDAVMAIWGFAPGEEDPVMQAFACAKAMIDSAAHMTFGNKPIAIGVGLNAGQVFIGNVGSEGKRQFTVLGHPVNMAARYESATKELQAPLVIGEAFACLLPGTLRMLLKRHEQVAIRGAGSQTLYTYGPGGIDAKGTEE